MQPVYAQGNAAFRLRRSIWVRLVGAPYQFYPSALTAFFVVLIVYLVFRGGTSAGVLAGSALPGLAEFVLLWTPGGLASARVDAYAIRWRYVIPRTAEWSQVRGLEFGRHRTEVSTHGGWLHSASVTVHYGTQVRRIAPVYGCGEAARQDFALALVRLAQQYRVPWNVHPDAAGLWPALQPQPPRNPVR